MSNNGPFISLVSFISVRTAVIVVLYIHRHSFCMCERPMSPADHADYAEGMQQAASYRRERQFCVVSVVLGLSA